MEDEAAIVVLCCCLLDFLLNRIQASLQYQLEVLLGQRDEFVLDQALLDLPLDDAPQGLDRVQLRAVRWQEHQLEVQVLCQSHHVLRVMGWVVVEDDEDQLVGILKLLPEHL